MIQRTWIILGATSIISENFARLVAKSGCNLKLVGRQKESLNLIAQDIMLRYPIDCDIVVVDLAKEKESILQIFEGPQEFDLFIAHSDFTDNAHLSAQTIKQLIQINITTTALVINAYLNKKQTQYNLLYLSSVAACRGRSKNSLYGASKACIEVYLEGLQQSALKNQRITIARLGFIDTKQTYGEPGIFYAAPPEACAKACWNALKRKKRMFYYPFFWWGIMAIITRLPFAFYKRLSGK